MNAGGYPQEFVDLLADCYHGVAQLANLLADWLIVAGRFCIDTHNMLTIQSILEKRKDTNGTSGRIRKILSKLKNQKLNFQYYSSTLFNASFENMIIVRYISVQGCSVEEVQELVEKHLKDLIMKNFDPKKADSIFSGAGQVYLSITRLIIFS